MAIEDYVQCQDEMVRLRNLPCYHILRCAKKKLARLFDESQRLSAHFVRQNWK